MGLKAVFFLAAILVLFGCVQRQGADFEGTEFETVKNPLSQCQELEEKIEALFSNTGNCSTADDCTYGVLESCEFGCYLIKNRAENTSELVSLVKQFDRQCSTCVTECGIAPTVFECIENKCVALAPKEF